MSPWVERRPEVIRQRYNRIAPFFRVFEWIFLMPPGMRSRAVDRMQLRRGDVALEIGCGTGRNLPYLLRATGSEGRVYGVDVSKGMLERAHRRSVRNGWQNIVLVRGDAAEYTPPEPADAVLFSLSYATMVHRLQVLRHCWDLLKPGGRLVIMDAKPMPGLAGRIFTPLGTWVSNATVLGNPEVRPWEDLRGLAGEVDMREFSMGSYFVACATKSTT